MITEIQDLFSEGRVNVFFYDDEIGSYTQEDGYYMARPYGLNTTAPFDTLEDAIGHLKETRNMSIAKATAQTVSKNQLPLF